MTFLFRIAHLSNANTVITWFFRPRINFYLQRARCMIKSESVPSSFCGTNFTSNNFKNELHVDDFFRITTHYFTFFHLRSTMCTPLLCFYICDFCNLSKNCWRRALPLIFMKIYLSATQAPRTSLSYCSRSLVLNLVYLILSIKI